MSRLIQCRSRDSLTHLLVLHSRVSVLVELLALANFKTVDLRFQGNELIDQIALSFVHDKGNFASVLVVRCTEAARVICMDFSELEQSLQLGHVQ